MNIIEKIAEEKIKTALENGDFDNLPGQGKPIDLTEYFEAPPHLRAAFNLLKNAGVLPKQVILWKEIEDLRNRRRRARDREEVLKISAEIERKLVQIDLMVEQSKQP